MSLHLHAYLPLYSLVYLYLFLASVACAFLTAKVNALNLGIKLGLGAGLIMLFMKLAMAPPEAAILLYKHFWGFTLLAFFIALLPIKLHFNFSQLLVFLSILTCIESILINTIIDPTTLANYPDIHNMVSHKTLYWGFYQRPYGVGANPSMTSGLIVGLIALHRNEHVERFKRQIFDGPVFLGVAAILACCSATGLGLLVLYFLIDFLRSSFAKKMRYVFVGAPLLLTLSLIGYTSMNRWNPEYFIWIIKYKFVELGSKYNFWNERLVTQLFGKSFDDRLNLPIYSDFAWANFLESFGLVGLAVLLLVLIPQLTRVSLLPMFIFLVGNFHYSPIWSISGQIVLALILVNLNNQKISTRRAQ